MEHTDNESRINITHDYEKQMRELQKQRSDMTILAELNIYKILWADYRTLRPVFLN